MSESNKKEVLTLLLSSDSTNLNAFQKQKIIDSAYAKIAYFTNDSTKRNLAFKIADRYYNCNRIASYYKTSKIALKLSEKDNDKGHTANALRYIGDYFEIKSISDSAFYFYNKSNKLFVEINDDANAGRTNMYKATILYRSGSYDEAQIEYIKALKLVLKVKNTSLLHECYELIGWCEIELHDYKNAIKYFNLSLKTIDKLKSEKFSKKGIRIYYSTTYNGFGNVYAREEQYPKAITMYKKGLALPNIKNDSPEYSAKLLNNLGYAELKLKNNSNKVGNYLFESLRLREKYNLDISIPASKMNIAEYYLFKQDTLKAVTTLKEGLQLAKKNKSSFDILNSLKLLTLNDKKNKNKYANLYFKVDDSIKVSQTAIRNKFSRILFETDQVEKQNVDLSEKYKNNILLSIFGGLILIIIIIIARIRFKNKQIKFNKEQQKSGEQIYQLMINQQKDNELAREEERNRIAMELHDGIVNSIFTTRFNLMKLKTDDQQQQQTLISELEDTEAEIRRVSHDLKQNLQFEDNNLPELITKLVANQKNKFDTVFDLTIDKVIDWSAIKSVDKVHIFRILQESIQNINKYSNAKKCLIMILKMDQHLIIRIWDDGVGFNIKRTKKGIGLKNITDRCRQMNAELKITSVANEGTKIEVVL